MGALNHGNITEIFPIRNDLPSELCQIRIVAYWQGSTELEEQTAALNSTYAQVISENPNREDVIYPNIVELGLSMRKIIWYDASTNVLYGGGYNTNNN